MKRTGFYVVMCFLVAACGSRVNKQEKAQGNKNYIKEGIQHLQEANPTEAIKSFNAAIKSNPGDMSGYIVLSETYMRMQEYNRAIDSLTAASRVAPDQGQIYYLLAINYGLIGDKEQAQENAKKSAEIFQMQKDQQNFVKSLALWQGIMRDKATPDKDTASQ